LANKKAKRRPSRPGHGWPELVTDILHTGSIGGIEQAVVQSGERDAPFLELAFHPLTVIEPDPAGERDTGAELDKRRGKLPVEDIEVVVVNTGAGAGEVAVRNTGGTALGPVGAKGGCLLPGDADEHYPLLARGTLEVMLSDFLLSLALPEMDNGNGVLFGKVLHGGDKVPGKTA